MVRGNPAKRRGLDVRRVWLQQSFWEQLEKLSPDDHRRYAAALECAGRIRTDPGNHGLALKPMKQVDGRQLVSARVDRANRLLLVQLGDSEYGIIRLEDHDSYESWVDRKKAFTRGELNRVQELRGDGRIFLPEPSPKTTDGKVDLEAIREMLAGGMEPYLAALHPDQRALATYDLTRRKGVTLVKGGAGTGKTSLAIARLIHVAQQPEHGYGGVLYLCFNHVLANVVRDILDNQYRGRFPRAHIQVKTLHEWAWDYLTRVGLRPELAPSTAKTRQAGIDRIASIVAASQALAQHLADLSAEAIREEIDEVLRPNGLVEVDQYIELERRGRPPLKVAQRRAIWEVEEQLKRDRRYVEWNEVPVLALATVQSDPDFTPYRSVVLDEAQDFGPVMIRLAKALVGGDDRRLFVVADPAQSIYRHGYYWAQRELGVKGGDVRWLRKPYRNTAQVYEFAAPLAELDEGAPESDRPTRQGPKPRLLVTRDRGSMVDELLADLGEVMRADEGWQPDNVAIIAPTWQALEEAALALRTLGLPFRPPVREDKKVKLADGRIKLLTIHSAKGLDFPIVYFFDATKTGFRKMETNERFLFYVALTRSAFKLTVLTVADDAHGLLAELDPDAYEIGGSAANLWPPARF
jgi:superfamily I DNA/RNA helicase